MPGTPPLVAELAAGGTVGCVTCVPGSGVRTGASTGVQPATMRASAAVAAAILGKAGTPEA